MQSKFINTEDAGYNSGKAAYRARMYHLEHESTYTQQQLTRAERMKIVLKDLYSAKNVFVTCRKTGINVKVDSPAGVRDKKALKQLHVDYAAEGIAIRPSVNGVNYWIAR